MAQEFDFAEAVRKKREEREQEQQPTRRSDIQISPEQIQRLRARFSQSPALPKPPTVGQSLKEWATSSEGIGATAVDVAGPMAGGIAGARYGSKFGPYGALIGAAIGAGVASVPSSAIAQNMRGDEISRTQVLSESLWNSIMFPAAGPGGSAWRRVGMHALRGAGLGVGGSTVSELSRTQDIEGYEVNPANIAASGVFGAALGGGAAAIPAVSRGLAGGADAIRRRVVGNEAVQPRSSALKTAVGAAEHMPKRTQAQAEAEAIEELLRTNPDPDVRRVAQETLDNIDNQPTLPFEAPPKAAVESVTPPLAAGPEVSADVTKRTTMSIDEVDAASPVTAATLKTAQLAERAIDKPSMSKTLKEAGPRILQLYKKQGVENPDAAASALMGRIKRTLTGSYTEEQLANLEVETTNLGMTSTAGQSFIQEVLQSKRPPTGGRVAEAPARTQAQRVAAGEPVVLEGGPRQTRAMKVAAEARELAPGKEIIVTEDLKMVKDPVTGQPEAKTTYTVRQAQRGKKPAKAAEPKPKIAFDPDPLPPPVPGLEPGLGPPRLVKPPPAAAKPGAKAPEPPAAKAPTSLSPREFAEQAFKAAKDKNWKFLHDGLDDASEINRIMARSLLAENGQIDEQGLVKSLVDEFINDDGGGLILGRWKRRPTPQVIRRGALHGDKRLDTVLKSMADDFRRFQRQPIQFTKDKFLTKFHKYHWAVVDAVNDSIRRNPTLRSVWDAGTNPVAVLERIVGGEAMAAIRQGNARMGRAYADLMDLGDQLPNTHKQLGQVDPDTGQLIFPDLREDFRLMAALKGNERVEITVKQHISNAKAAYDRAAAAWAAAKGKKAGSRAVRRAKAKMDRAEKHLKKKEARWKQLEKDDEHGLIGGRKPGESSVDIAKIRARYSDAPDVMEAIDNTLGAFAERHREALMFSLKTGTVSKADALDFLRRGDYISPVDDIGKISRSAIRNLGKLRTATAQKLGVPEPEILKEYQAKADARMAADPVFASMLHYGRLMREGYVNMLVRNFVTEFRKVPELEPVIKQVNAKQRANLPPGIEAIPLYENGKVRWWSMPEELARLTMNPTRLELSKIGMLQPLLDPFIYTKRAFTFGVTAGRTAFTFGTNMFRDIFQGRVALPEAFKLLRPDDVGLTMAQYFRAVGRLRRDPMGLDDTGVSEFWRSGAGLSALTSNMLPSDMVDRVHMQAMLGDKVGTFGKLANGFRMSVDFAKNTNSAMETAMKLITFERLRAADYTPEAAAMLARAYGGSPDFAIGGEWRPALDLMSMFYNPTLRGIEQNVNIMKRLRDMPAKLPKVPTEKMKRGALDAFDEFNDTVGLIQGMGKLAKSKLPALMAASLTTAIGLSLWNHNPMFRDENGEYYIERIPSWVRANNFVMQFPIMMDTPMGPAPFYLAIPKSFTSAIMETPLAKLAERALWDEKSEYTDGINIAYDMAESMSPIPIAEIGHERGLFPNIATSAASAATPLARVPAEMFAGRKFYSDIPIAPGSTQGMLAEDVTNRQQASPAIQNSSQLANELYRKAMGEEAGIKPAYVEYFISQMSPGPVEEVFRIEELVNSTLVRDSFGNIDFNMLDTLRRTLPFAGGLVNRLMGPGSGTDARTRALRDEFYKIRDRAAAYERSLAERLEADPDYDDIELQQQFPEEVTEMGPAWQEFSSIMDEIHDARGKAYVELASESDPAKRRVLQEDIIYHNEDELEILRDWKNELDYVRSPKNRKSYRAFINRSKQRLRERRR